MENEIKVGEFIRTKLGDIKKITEGFEFIIKRYNESDNKIVKHSPNIIDIIEEGDYVNGEIVDKIFNPRFLSFGELPYIITANNKYEPQEIEEIVTKEQFKSISYKVTKM